VPSSSTPFISVLGDLKRAFRAEGVRWYVFGAQAAIIYGAARLTADVDVTADVDEVPTQRLLGTLKRHGFAPQFDDAAFVQATRVLPVTHRATKLPVDIVFSGPGLEDLFFERATLVKLGSTRFPVASIEDLVVMKVLAGRSKDMGDISMLLATGNVDAKQVEATLKFAEQLLDQSDLVPTFKKLVRAGSRQKREVARELPRQPRNKVARPKKRQR
jgi:hypothetical protein